MSTPTGARTKPPTRSAKKRATEAVQAIAGQLETGSSPVIKTARKRKNSAAENPGEPASKRMADSQILEAINGIKTSVAAMEAQMKTAPTKDDLAGIVTEIRGVKESVIRNTDRIDTLFDLRKSDDKLLTRKVERIVENKMGTTATGRPQSGGSKEENFLRCRRSVRFWPVTGTGNEQGVQTFLKSILKIPDAVIEGLQIEKIERISQTRRSTIKDEVLVRFANSQQRDVIQSYASNLAAVQGKAGIRIEVPDHLRGLFRQYETHAANLKNKFGSLKRAIRFDNAEQSLYMDVKLDNTDWHRVSAEDMKKVQSMAKRNTDGQSSSSRVQAEKKRILLQEDQPECVQVESDEDDFSDAEDNDPRK